MCYLCVGQKTTWKLANIRIEIGLKQSVGLAWDGLTHWILALVSKSFLFNNGKRRPTYQHWIQDNFWSTLSLKTACGIKNFRFSVFYLCFNQKTPYKVRRITRPHSFLPPGEGGDGRFVGPNQAISKLFWAGARKLSKMVANRIILRPGPGNRPKFVRIGPFRFTFGPGPGNRPKLVQIGQFRIIFGPGPGNRPKLFQIGQFRRTFGPGPGNRSKWLPIGPFRTIFGPGPGNRPKWLQIEQFRTIFRPESGNHPIILQIGPFWAGARKPFKIGPKSSNFEQFLSRSPETFQNVSKSNNFESFLGRGPETD